MTIVGYCRVSSREQAENSHALEQQIDRVRRAGADQVFVDVESGSRDDRPEFEKLMQQVSDRTVDEVIVTRLDRLSRKLLTLRVAIAKFEASGVMFRALDDALDTRTAAGKFHLNMLGALAEMEVDRLSERVRHGWQHLRDKKVAVNPPFGYCKVNDKLELDFQPFLCLISDRSEFSKAHIARHILEAFLQEKSLRACLRLINQYYGISVFAHTSQQGRKKGGRVAQQMFRFSPGGLRNYLTSPVICGHLTYLKTRGGKRLPSDKWQVYYNTHDPLISEAEFREIEEILAYNRQHRGYGSTALKFPASGLVFCGECRSACYSLSGQRGKQPGRNYYYQCKNWTQRACSQKSTIRMELVEEAIVLSLTTRAEQLADRAMLSDRQDEPLELRELRSQLQQLWQIPNPHHSIQIAIKDLEVQIQNFLVRASNIEDLQQSDRDLLVQMFSDRQVFEPLTVEEKQVYYRQFVDRVIVKDGAVQTVDLKV